MYIHVIDGQPKRMMLFFVLLVSGLFQPVLAYGLFHITTLLTSDNITEHLPGKFAIKQLHVDFITKRGKHYHKIGPL